MRRAPYQHSYQRARPENGPPAAGYLPNPASGLTDRGADPAPRDLAWCIRHEWRVLYYAARHAAGLPIWDGVDDFEVLMTDVLFRLSSAFKPIPPLRSREAAVPKDNREDRVYQPFCRIYRTPVFDWREEED
jgi:hypothetical protein